MGVNMPRRLGVALMILALAMGTAQAAPLLVASGEAPPLPAWTDFCAEEPAECRPDPKEPETVAATPELLELIDAVNRYVNRTILAVTDQDHWGVIDDWSFPVEAMGDCEDIQLLKRKYLIEAGVPRRALPMTVVLDELGEGHAVLTVRTDREDLILDNKNNTVKRWDRTGYTFIKREGGAATGWVFLEAKPAPVTTAAAQ
jgi:predicted transglutaminase-like cysteine proteinase